MATTHTVVQGDTLWDIAQRYLGDPMKYKQLAAINNISNPNLIYVGQVIKLSNDGGGSGGTSSKPNPPSTATINQFGLQSNTENTLFAVWSWDRSNTENYQTIWYYDSGDNHWFIGSDSTTNHKESTYSIPANAKRVKFKVKPISETYTVNNAQTSYWTASWSTEKIYNVSDSPPKKPSTPTVKIDKYKLTAELDNIDPNTQEIQFQVVKNNTSVFNTGTATVILYHASYSIAITAGDEFKVRCRAVRNNRYSDWSDYSSNASTIPSAPKGITTCRANSDTSVYLEWESVASAKTYDIEYTTKKEYFDGSDKTSTVTGIEFTHYEKTGLETGQEYFFRVRAVNDKGYSAWTEMKSVAIGKDPEAPTTWSSTTTAITGEPLLLYWVHNTEDGSSETYAELELYIDGRKESYTLKKSTDEEEKDKTSFYSIDTSEYDEGVKIQWRVRTAGVTKRYGDWSVQRTIDIYAPPTLELKVTDVDGELIETLTSFPFYISGLAGPNTQAPIGYHVTITSNEMYEMVDQIGNKRTVNKGEQVYAKHFDISEALLIEISANNIDLENNVSYTISCLVTMNSGLTTSSTSIFTVAWNDAEYEPNAEISIDRNILATYIRPYCERYVLTNYKVTHDTSDYIITNESIGSVWGEAVDGGFTDNGIQVYQGMTADGEELYYCTVNEKSLVEDITLSVYRREFDGTFTELATGLVNSENTFITDPHPALDYARYRIVAITTTTGAVSYYDVPGCPVGEKAVIIQWDEDWSSFDVSSEDTMEQPPWSGSMLKLPYNIDVSDKHNSDVSLIEYIGRKHPVSYYGTQLGETSSWKVDIDKEDIETLYALRRLAIWMGDVYVREPSGSGYWANISVSFSQTHCETTIPVTLEIARVEGGI